jgi:hypothetical protein
MVLKVVYQKQLFNKIDIQSIHLLIKIFIFQKFERRFYNSM